VKYKTVKEIAPLQDIAAVLHQICDRTLNNGNPNRFNLQANTYPH